MKKGKKTETKTERKTRRSRKRCFWCEDKAPEPIPTQGKWQLPHSSVLCPRCDGHLDSIFHPRPPEIAQPEPVIEPTVGSETEATKPKSPVPSDKQIRDWKGTKFDTGAETK